KLPGEKTRAILARSQQNRARTISKDRGRLLVVPVEIFGDRVRTHNQHISISRISDDELRRSIKGRHKPGAGAVHVKRSRIHGSETMLHDNRRSRRKLLGRVSRENDQIQLGRVESRRFERLATRVCSKVRSALIVGSDVSLMNPENVCVILINALTE